jgi:hypothetical protein
MEGVMEPNDDIGTVRWFGEPWGAPVCEDPRARILTPLEVPCAFCGTAFRHGDQGVSIQMVFGSAEEAEAYAGAHQGRTVLDHHRECVLQMIQPVRRGCEE